LVRLVFRPYAQLRGSICTSDPIRASTRVSPGFALVKHSSPTFGSQHVCSYSNQIHGRSMVQVLPFPPDLLSLRFRVCHPTTRKYARLLGPCYKTGSFKAFWHRPNRESDNTKLYAWISETQKSVDQRRTRTTPRPRTISAMQSITRSLSPASGLRQHLITEAHPSSPNR